MSVLLIANPIAGGYCKQKIEKIKKILSDKFGVVELHLTTHKGNAYEVAKGSVADLIVVVGGDGLLNEVASGMIEGRCKLFSFIPMGTANVFAYEHGINLDPIKAANNLKLERAIDIPVGVIGDRYFLLMASFGFDAFVVKRIEANRKKVKINRKLLYYFYGLLEFIRLRKTDIYISANGVDHILSHLIVSVSSSYGGKYILGWIEKGKLNLFSLFKHSRWHLFKSIVSLIRMRGYKGFRMQVDSVKIQGVSECQIDGEYYKLDKDSVYLYVINNELKLAL